MEESPSPPQAPSPSPGEELRAGFASFDAASFLESQQNERERKAAELLAAADALCPSSSEDTSSSSDSSASEAKNDDGLEEGEVVGQKRKERNKPAPDEKHLKKRKKHHHQAKKPTKSKRERQKSKGSEKERRRHKKKAQAEFARQVAAEVAAGEGSRKSSFNNPVSSTLEHHHQEQQQEGACYYSEKRPDPGNIAFGKMYRFDIPLYRRYDPSGYVVSLLKLGRDYTIDDKGGQSSKALKRKDEKGKTRNNWGATTWWRPRRLVETSSRKENLIDLTSKFESGYVPLDSSRDFMKEKLSFALPRKDGQRVMNEEELKEREEQGLEKDARDVYVSPEDYLLQKTRDFNAALRQTPENLQLWLDFSAFQDESMEISGGKRRRGAVRATAEKQISVLERGLEHHPGSDVLLLALLDVASKICDAEEMEKRWQRVLISCPGSLKLWKAFLQKKRHQFANFKTGDVATAHYQALSALKLEKSRLLLVLNSQGGEIESMKIQLAELDNSLVEIVLLAISFNLQTGYTELGIAAVRALLEYTWFAPEGWPEDALEMMFEDFYKTFIDIEGGGLKMIGDAGAVGWGAWISGEEEEEAKEDFAVGNKTGRNPSTQEEVINEEPGGWVEVPREEIAIPIQTATAAEGGVSSFKAENDEEKRKASPWEELAPAIRARFGHALDIGENRGNNDVLEEKEKEEYEIEKELILREEEEKHKEQEETEEQLLSRLGMDLDAALANEEEELTPDVLSTWLNLECQRDGQQWEASRANIEEASKTEGREEEVEEEKEENPFNMVPWEDISPYIISIHNNEAREKLLTGCLQLLGVPLLRSTSSSSVLAESQDEISAAASWLGIGGTSLEPVDPSAVSVIDESEWAWLSDRAVLRDHAVRDMPWWAATKERHGFVLNILSTLLKNKLYKSNYELAFATLNLASWKIIVPCTQQSLSCTLIRDWAASRALAKQLLAEQRDNLVLYAAFAAIEKLSGRGKAARKVYSACLSGLQKLPGEERALPAGLVELVLGFSQLELQETAADKKEKDIPTSKNEAEGSSFLRSLPHLLRATPQALYAAARPLLFLGSRGKICLETSAKDTNSNLITSQEEIVVARRGYQDSVLRVLRAGPEGFDAQDAVAQVSAAAAAELVFAACSIEGGGIGSSRNVEGGITAALALYKQVIDAISSSSCSRSSSYFSNVLERVEIQRCALAVDAAVHAVHVVPPTLAREFLSKALQRYPSSPSLLRMLRSLEVNAHALTALRRQLNTILASSPSVPAWMMLIGVEIGANAARTAIRAALLRALSHPSSGMHSPVLWRCSLRFERAFGTPESLHRAFLRAVEACPWSKSLWCDGLELLNGYCSPKELLEYLSIMKDKELAVRTDVLEAVLARLK